MENLLEKIGLTQNETKVYLALNELGTTTIGPIVDRAGITNSKIYITLEKLIQKGLVAHLLINHVKHYKASPPERLLDFLEEKKKKISTQELEIKNIIPQLLLKQQTGLKEREVEVYEGFNGIKTVRERILNILKKKDELLILGASKFSTSQYEHYWENFHKRRIAQNISCRYLMYEELRKTLGKKRETWRLTTVKYIQNPPENPIRVDVYSDYVDIAIDAVSPFVISIKSKDVNGSFRAYFESLWKVSRK
ncbi:hypothetical protein HYW21_04355 [Candidatus Woesearchaeota archaeon]|nr:hypothetical protein [Candidatus Woesearchaeota archaeon]